jgi:hypothetical protein
VKENMTETELLAARLMRLEARVMALMNICAALIKHHGGASEVRETIRLLVDLNESTLLNRPQPDWVAEQIAKTAGQVLRLADVEF